MGIGVVRGGSSAVAEECFPCGHRIASACGKVGQVRFAEARKHVSISLPGDFRFIEVVGNARKHEEVRADVTK